MPFSRIHLVITAVQATEEGVELTGNIEPAFCRLLSGMSFHQSQACGSIFDLLCWKGVYSIRNFLLRMHTQRPFNPTCQASFVGVVTLPRMSILTTFGTRKMTTRWIHVPSESFESVFLFFHLLPGFHMPPC